MIFDCGPTPEEAWKREQARLESWHPFFALWPRVVAVDDNGNQTCAWMQMIERKGTYYEPSIEAMCFGARPWWTWEFQLPERHEP